MLKINWDTGCNEEPLLLNRIAKSLDSLMTDHVYSFCAEKNITLYNIKRSDIIVKLNQIGTVFAVNDSNYYFIKHNGSVCSKLKITNRTNYITIHFTIFSFSKHAGDCFYADLQDLYKEHIEAHNMLNISWYCSHQHGTISYDIEEMYNDEIHSCAYPYIKDFKKYVQDYVDSDEQVLILLGPPGTGKSRMIRYILHCLTTTYGANSNILYTNDSSCLEQEELYMDFLTRDCLALVAEDVDHHLKNRNDGSYAIYRILNAADGLIRGFNRKILLSTNIPSVKDIDEALIRPGRCYDVITTRKLTLDESYVLYGHISDDPIKLTQGTYSVAELYRLAKKEKLRKNDNFKLMNSKES